MATTVNRNVNIYIQSGEAEKAYDRLVKKEQQLRKELENATDPKIVKRLQGELDKLQEPIDRAGKKFRGELTPSFRDLQNTVNSLGRRLKQMSEQDADYTKVLAQYNAANVALKEQKKNIDQVAKATKEGASESSKISLGAGVGTFVANFATKAIDVLKNVGSQAIQTALQTEGVKNAFDRLNKPGLLEELRKSTKGTVNDLELMKRAVAANNFQIPIEKLGTLLQFAQRRARETGQSVDYLVDSIVTGIARKSPLILDNLGINIKRVNDEFKKTGDFAQAAFNVVDQELAKAGPALNTHADKVDRIKAKWDNFLSFLGQKFFNITDIIEAPFKSAGELFDEAKRATEGYEQSLQPLLQRYDELKSKTNLNKEEQDELRGVIQRIVEVVPDSVTEFNKYGEALDINRGKVENFLKVNKEILAEKEFRAVDEIFKKIDKSLASINVKQSQLKEGVKVVAGALGTGSVQTVSFTDDEKRQLTADIRDLQIKSVEAADLLKSKYGKDLPDSVKKAIESIRGLLTGIQASGPKTVATVQQVQDTITELQKKIQAATEERDNAIIGTKEYNDAVQRLKVLQDRLDKLLGRKEKQKENLFERFNQQLQEQAQQLDAYNKSQIDKELLANDIKYDKFRQQYLEAFNKRQLTEKQLGELLNDNEDLRGREQSLIYQKWVEEINRKRLDEDKKTQDRLKQQELDRLQQLLAFQETVARAAAATADKVLKKRQFRQEVDLLFATGKERLAIKIQQLEDERQRELANAEKTNLDVADINRKYNKLIADEKLNSAVELINKVLGFIQSASQVLNSFFDAANQRDQQQLEEERIRNERKKESYKRQLDGKLISQKEYEKNIRQLEKQQDEREKQVRLREFNRNKITNLINTSITVSRGIAEALATPPVPNIGLATFMGLLGGAQLAFIAAQKPPKLARGGRLDGPTHQQGGMPVINPTTGRKVAEVEGGEVILSRNTVRNNAALVNQLLHTSLYNNGAPVVPKWKNNNPSYLNLPVINESMNRVRMFEKGGVITSNNSDNDASAASMAVMANLQSSIDILNSQLATGITAFVSISQSEKQQHRIDAIRADATIS